MFEATNLTKYFPQLPIDENLILDWDFSEGVGHVIQDRSSHKHGGFIGFSYSWEMGLFGNSVRSYPAQVLAVNAEWTALTNQLTVLGWFKIGTSGTLINLASRGAWGNEVFTLQILSTGQLRFRVTNADRTQSGEWVSVGLYLPGWLFIACTFDGSRYDASAGNLYLNGSLMSSTYTGNLRTDFRFNTWGYTYLGLDYNGLNRNFTGNYQSFSIYTRALSSLEISNYYANSWIGGKYKYSESMLPRIELWFPSGEPPVSGGKRGLNLTSMYW